jgi:hypothetical protein
MRIGLISCCKEKKPGRWPAAELYLSPLFKKSMAYVQRTTHAWGILSAKHGLVLPGDVIDSYDTSLNDASRIELRTWAMETNFDIRGRWPHWNDGKTTFVVIAGQRYRECLVDLPHTVPFNGLGIGSLMQAIDASLNPVRVVTVPTTKQPLTKQLQS